MTAKMLICENPSCRFLIDLRENGKTMERSSLVIDFCPECGSGWSDRCPFCSEPLDAIFKERPRCASCNKEFAPTRPGRA